MIIVCLNVNAQYNPIVLQPTLSEKPIDLSIDSLVTIGFKIGNSGIAPLDRWQTRPMRFNLSYSKLEIANPADIESCITGNLWFSVQYSPVTKSFLFTQNAEIPGALNGGIEYMTILSKVTIASSIENKTNGFRINIQPPSYTIGAGNTEPDDEVSIYTYTTHTILPVELVRFEGSINQCKTELIWETASELNNDYFSIQKSTNGTDWDEIAQVKGNGNSTTPISYRYTDEDLNSSLAYYRLVQTDYDGQNEMSKVITVDGQECSGTGFKLYPNPTHDFINIELDNIKENYKYVIYSALGDIVRASDFSNPVYKIAVGDLPSGSYLINLVSGTKQISKKFIVQK